MTDTHDDWTVQILAPQPPERAFEAREDSGPVEQRSELMASRRDTRVIDASVDAIKENWRETVQKLAEIGDGIDDDSTGWGISEIEVGLTLSATGRLLFIAEASAEASVKITLTRRQG